MPHQIDRAKTAEQNLVDLINDTSDYTFTGAEFTHGAPEEYTPVSPDTSNTQVLLTAAPGSGVTGTKIITYRRLEMGRTVKAAPLTFQVTSSDNQASVEELIAEAHNLVLGQFYLSGSIPSPGGSDTNCILHAYSDSLLYFGTCPITLTLEAN